MNTPKLYIWAYKAKVQGGRGFIRGRVEAPTGSHAEQAIKRNNLMVDSIDKIKIDRSVNARILPYEKWEGAA
ncbi:MULTISPECIES: hypothetical protein [unclassified Acinetobacter]|uniref:hypothetical protein n=1 Tax=unclassified Acinetobacter TaxID=196816 RepID=UPI00293469B2|nr:MULTISPECIES: hypothetical protein [unclassified Acinetobacter]WOE32785.1 hypothetical protein QSG84_06315 [Acinetobacter sp. SAAs470]WOE38262.1 hypothetical protein QSG86_15370 [Acinetobacter sp. SAAs474]